jgi:hypothetical protein
MREESSAHIDVGSHDGPSPVRRVVAGGLAVGAVAAIAAGFLFGTQASDRAEIYRSTIGTNAQLDALRSDSESAARTSNILFIAGGGLIAGAALLWFLPTD